MPKPTRTQVVMAGLAGLELLAEHADVAIISW
jgi:hypothetical protein